MGVYSIFHYILRPNPCITPTHYKNHKNRQQEQNYPPQKQNPAGRTYRECVNKDFATFVYHSDIEDTRKNTVYVNNIFMPSLCPKKQDRK